MAKEEVEQMPFEIDITENEIYKLGARQALAKGRAKWLARGRQEGRLEAARQMLAKLAENRFGPLPAAALTRLERADQEQLDGWVNQFHTISKVSNLFQ